MKVLSLTQPWATLMAIGEKRIETRSWSTRHRGPLAIAAAKGFPVECQRLCFERPFAEALARGGITTLAPIMEARGHILAIVDVIDCLPTDGEFVRRSLLRPIIAPTGQSEMVFGDYSTGRFGWLTDNLRRLATPIAAKGALGLWEFPDSALAIAGTPGKETK